MGIERHCLQDCDVGDWVMAGGEYPGKVKIKMARALQPATTAQFEQSIVPMPDPYAEVIYFERVWIEPGGVFTAWRRVR